MANIAWSLLEGLILLDTKGMWPITFALHSPLKPQVILTLLFLFHLSVTSLPPSTTLSHTAVSQGLVMSTGGVASDGSVTLTLADAQGMLDGVTLNLNAQVRQCIV